MLANVLVSILKIVFFMSGCVSVCLNTGWVCFVCVFRESFCAQFFVSVLMCFRCLAVMCVCVSLSVYKSLSPYIYCVSLSIHLPLFHVHSPSLHWDISALFTCRLYMYSIFCWNLTYSLYSQCFVLKFKSLLSICKCYQKLKCSLYL